MQTRQRGGNGSGMSSNDRMACSWYGRCKVGLGEIDAPTPLREAAALFSAMGFRPALAQTEALLDQASSATTVRTAPGPRGSSPAARWPADTGTS